MGDFFKNIITVLLSLLIIAGNGGISIFAHSCSQEHHTVFYMDNEDIDCEHLYMHHSCCEESKNCHGASECCDIKTIVLKFDQHTISYNKEKHISFNSDLFLVKSEWPVVLSEDIHQMYYTDDLYKEEIIPLLHQKKILKYYTQSRISSDPLLS